MPAEGGEAEVKGSLRYESACRRGGGGDRGRHLCDARPLGGIQPNCLYTRSEERRVKTVTV